MLGCSSGGKNRPPRGGVQSRSTQVSSNAYAQQERCTTRNCGKSPSEAPNNVRPGGSMFTPSRDRMATKSRGARHQQNKILPGVPRKDQPAPRRSQRSCEAATHFLKSMGSLLEDLLNNSAIVCSGKQRCDSRQRQFFWH